MQVIFRKYYRLIFELSIYIQFVFLLDQEYLF